MNDGIFLLAFIVSLLVSVFSISRIIVFARHAGLYDKPDSRKIHVGKISNLGGIGVFMASIFAYFAFSNFAAFPRPDTLFSISILLFFIGLKDDIKPVKAHRRLIYEFTCAAFIIYFTDMRITSLLGIFSVTSLPYWASFLLTSLFIVACINAYNMIDGIDGLLGTLSMLGTTLFGIMFHVLNEHLWTVLCVSVLGSLAGFMIYNRHPARVFMGNGGSMFVGTFFACASLKFMQAGAFEIGPPALDVKILVPHTIVLGIISIPIFDMLSVFVIRLLNGQSPFNADRRHTHHRLLSLGLSQRQVVHVLLLANLTILLLAYLVQETGAARSLLYTMLYCAGLQALLLFACKYKRARNTGKRPEEHANATRA
jgi:UDP-N-acetylmuramyl pentapeptide phosphotransferase/UDP-N-acetylglucosamine-1-phosphate transferase